jgi:hypothetical protein
MTMLYKKNGPYLCDGRKVDYKVFEESDIEQALSDGWLYHADAWKDEEAKEVDKRAELEDMATKLSIKFDGRTSDAKLQKLIEDELDKA